MSDSESQSVLAFFGLREQPFAPTADPAYFYAAREHKECLFRLWHSVDERHGIAVILGNYGTGKTTLLRKLLSGMSVQPERYRTAVIGSPIPSWTSFALLEAIITQFGLRPEKRSFVAYMEALNQDLLRHRGQINTLIIDDAQNLNKRGQLELLRLAQNLETQQHKLLNLVLLAQMEWAAVLRARPNFEQRINMTFVLSPLSLEDTRNLIEFRLNMAVSAPEKRPIFDDAAIRMIYSYAEGSPRVTVTMCRNALLVAAQVKTRRIGQDVVLHTVDKTTLPDPEKRSRLVALAMQTTDVQVRSAPPKRPETPPPSPTERLGQGPREQRAVELLLRAAKSREKHG